jgi:FkbM family methyltransferase
MRVQRALLRAARRPADLRSTDAYTQCILIQILVQFRSKGFTRRNIWRVVRNTGGARREAVRACVFLLADRVTPLLGVEHDGLRYVLSSRESTGVCFPTFVRGFFDEETVLNTATALARHAGIETLEGLTVLEVGANIGTETVSFLMRHRVARVIAIEPDPENARLLRANLALNGLQERVVVYEMALSDVDGTVLLEHSEGNWGDHRIRVEKPFGPDLYSEGLRTTSEVSARRLDSLVDSGALDLDDVDLMWMDAQGHEAHILDGCEQLVRAGTPIVTEYWPYGLQRVGALDRFHRLVAERHDAVVDLREPSVALAAENVPQLAERYAAESSKNAGAIYTDLLLLPRSPSGACQL